MDLLIDKRAPLEKDIRDIEAEVGPIKYVAELIYGTSAVDYLDSAIRAVIIILVIVFDPLAVALVIAGNMTIKEARDARPKPIAPAKVAETLDMDQMWIDDVTEEVFDSGQELDDVTEEVFDSEQELDDAREEYEKVIPKKRTNMDAADTEKA